MAGGKGRPPRDPGAAGPVPAVTYEVRVTGLVPEAVLEEFGDVTMTTTAVSTVLSGSVTDQSALLGMLARLRALGLDVMEVRRVLGVPEEVPHPDPALPTPRASDDQR
jgi:hypothetical protein